MWAIFWAEQSTISITRAGHSYVSRFCWPTSLGFGAPKFYWGSNATKKEGKENSIFPLVRMWTSSFFRKRSTQPQRAKMCCWVSIWIIDTRRNPFLSIWPQPCPTSTSCLHDFPIPRILLLCILLSSLLLVYIKKWPGHPNFPQSWSSEYLNSVLSIVQMFQESVLTYRNQLKNFARLGIFPRSPSILVRHWSMASMQQPFGDLLPNGLSTRFGVFSMELMLARVWTPAPSCVAISCQSRGQSVHGSDQTVFPEMLFRLISLSCEGAFENAAACTLRHSS